MSTRSVPRARRLRLATEALCAAIAMLVAVIAHAAPSPLAQPPAVSAAPALDATPVRPLLWRVSDGDNAIYVLGSFHLLAERDYPLPVEIDAAFDDAERVVFEVSPADFARASEALADAGSLLAPRQLVRDVLPPPVREKLALAAVETGLTMADFDRLEPWAANMSLVGGMTRALGLSAGRGLDQHLMRRATDDGKHTGGLETVADQQRALAGASLSEQIRALNDLLDNRQLMSRTIADLHAAWRSGDVPRLDRLARRSMQEQNPDSYRLINVERNDRWMPLLQAMLDDEGTDETLVVVGSLHVLGPDGVVERLRARGYRVERLCDECAASVAAH